MKKIIRQHKKSLRTMLMVWLLGFAVVPLAFITGYSLRKYQEAIDKELGQRLVGNQREIRVIFQEFQEGLAQKNKLHANDKSLIYLMSANSIGKARELATKWMRGTFTRHLSIFNREGRLEVALYREPNDKVSRHVNLGGSDFYLSEKFINEASAVNQLKIVDFRNDGVLDLIVFSKIQSSSGKIVGYIEEILRIDQSFIEGLKDRLNLELIFFSEDGTKMVSSHADFKHYKQDFFLEKYKELKGQLFELNIQEEPYGMKIGGFTWGDKPFYVVIGASKRAAKEVLKNVNTAFFTVVGAAVLVLIILSFILSKIMLQPLNFLVERLRNIDFDNKPEVIEIKSDNELGALTDSFNQMASSVYEAQLQLKENIKKLELANIEIRETQARLVHAAKMASLGQLVAGVAHELNNPISFIFGNMAHLRDYSDRLVRLVQVRNTDAKAFEEEKTKLEFDYIVSDMPKLIQSCEGGARRTRDIVLGLRNFSRLDEAKLKEVDIHEGIESTLELLSSEFKSRIKVTKNYGQLPKVSCYPSQLNQVFMNILTNAAHAIKDTGEVTITTKKINDASVQVSIRDSGVGMSDEIKEKLFDPFFTTKEVSKGTGLGMSISYSVIKKHNGDITVNSKINAGSEFIITLPIHLQA